MTNAATLPRQTDSLAVPAWEITSLGALIVFYFASNLASGVEPDAFTNAVGPFALAAILTAGALNAASREPAALWTGLLWFRLSTAIYYGIGTNIRYVVNNETLVLVESFFLAGPEHIATFNMIVACSAFCVLATAGLCARLYPYNKRWSNNTSNDGRLLLRMGIFFALIGFGVKFLISLPATFGLWSTEGIPGIILSLEHFAPPSIFLLTLWSLRYGHWLQPLVLLLTLTSAIVGFLRFGKGETLQPILMYALAYNYHRTSLKKLIVSALLIGGLYHLIAAPITYGRARIVPTYGSFATAPFGERMAALNEYFEHGEGWSAAGDLQGSIARLAYVYSAAPAIDFYNRGIYGTSLQDAYVVLFPRFLWPDKPIFDHGTRYNAMVNGNAASSSWMGYFVEAYWNLGPWGIPLIMIPVGIAFFIFGRYAQFVLSTESWLHFPMIFLGMYLGLRVDGSLVTEFFVTCVLAVLYHFAANGAAVLLRAAAVTQAPPPVYSRPASPPPLRRPQ